ncbi:MAG: LysE family translocator [Pseudomonadota bacterium]
MFEISIIFTFIVASAAIVIVPGPTVSLIIANSLRAGPAAGMANIFGTQVGLATMILVLALGLDAVVAFMGEAFVYIKVAGAAYLIYLGVKLLRGDGSLAQREGAQKSHVGYAVQGFFVIWSNPKALLFFGAFIPQFVDPAANAAVQVLVYGALFMVVATIFDGAYALAAGRAGRLLTRARLRVVERLSGGFLVMGGIGLALTRR